jgi:phage shock protein A
MFPFVSEPSYSKLAKEESEKLSKHGQELAKWLLKEMEKHQKLFAYVSAASLLVAVTALGIRAAWPRIKAKYEQIRAKHSTVKPTTAKSKSRSKRRKRSRSRRSRSHSRSGSSAASAVRGKAKEVHKYAKEMADWFVGEIKKNPKLFAAVSAASLAVVATAFGIRKAWPRIKAKLEEIRDKVKRRGSASKMDGPTIEDD